MTGLKRARGFTPSETDLEAMRKPTWERFLERLTDEVCANCKAKGRLRAEDRDDRPAPGGERMLRSKTVCGKCGHREDWECVWS